MKENNGPFSENGKSGWRDKRRTQRLNYPFCNIPFIPFSMFNVAILETCYEYCTKEMSSWLFIWHVTMGMKLYNYTLRAWSQCFSSFVYQWPIRNPPFNGIDYQNKHRVKQQTCIQTKKYAYNTNEYNKH